MIRAFEGGRGVAALVVALFHFKLIYQIPLIQNGYLFVDLFFVLSGFLICSLYWRRLETGSELRPFLIRRFGRLFPLLVFSTILFILAKNGLSFVKNQLVWHGYAHFPSGISGLGYELPKPDELLATFTMTHGLGLFDELILNGVSWSISVEFYSYLVFALLCLSVPAGRRIWFFAVLALGAYAASIWASLAVHDCHREGYCLDLTYDFGFLRCLAAFFLGALAWLLGRTARFNPGRVQAVVVLGLAAVFALVAAAPILAFACPLLFGALVLSISRDEGWLARILKGDFFQLLGQRSYSIYMMHPILLIMLSPLHKLARSPVQSLLLAILYCATVIVLSGWTYRWIESPFRAYFNQRAGKAVAA